MKMILWLIGLLIVGGGAYWWMGKDKTTAPTEMADTSTEVVSDKTAVVAGVYGADTATSGVKWSAGKPLIEGYINSGTIAFKDGSITVTESAASGKFTIDMTTIKVGLTSKKPGRESALETHLKSKDFFDVAKYPTGEFTIDSVLKRADSDATHVYDVTGTLTLKGKKNAVTFPAEIYMKDGMLHAHAKFEIDRTKWGITYGSGSFFDNLADNAIDDMVHLELSVIASKSQ